MSKKAIILTYEGEAHFFAGKEPKDFMNALSQKYLALPSGSVIATASIKGIYTHEDYRSLHETADHHKKREWLGSDGNWRDAQGAIVERADMKRLINKTDHALPQANTHTLGSGPRRNG